jgi:hypothetical protein
MAQASIPLRDRGAPYVVGPRVRVTPEFSRLPNRFASTVALDPPINDRYVEAL